MKATQQIPRIGNSRKKKKRYTMKHLRAIREKEEGGKNARVSSPSY
jgi:hypothetical protein